jgi:crotonobetainyl-CoA:carnitine CoA-transferase CaiB-like acyl-CoA transferase
MKNTRFAPLSGIRVLELASNLAGPYCAQILHDLGADVIKIEPAGGDAARQWGPPFIGADGSIFAAVNRGKRSITLDPRAEPDRAMLRDLITESDVLVEALRPGAFDALGFGWEAVRSWNSRLVYCSVLAYGETGPLRELAGYDPLMQAHAGLMSVTGAAGGEPVRVGTSIVDMGSAMWLSIAVLAALRERDSTGEGRRVSVALYDTALAWNAYHLMGYTANGFVPGRMGTELPMIAPYGVFAAADGELMLAAANDRLFERLCAALGRDDLSRDNRYRDNPSRVAHRIQLREQLEASTRAHSKVALLTLLREAGVPCAPVQNIAEVAADPQTHASGLLRDGPTFGLPIRIDGERPGGDGRTPRIGEHNEELLARGA